MKIMNLAGKWVLSLIALGLLGGVQDVNADNLSNSALLDRIEALEAELYQQRIEFAGYSGGKSDGGSKGGACYDVCETDCPAWYAGYEITVLKPHVSSNLANYLGAPGWDGSELPVGHRFVIGRDGGTGMGARIRYWTYNTGAELAPPGANPLNMDLDVLDLELTLNEKMCNWEFLLSGGLRYGRAGFSLGADEVYFEGTGPTVSLEARRDFGCRGLYFIGNARTSLLMGEIRDRGGLIAAPLIGNTVEDEIALGIESQLGIGWSREMGAFELHIRGLWETQFWFNGTFANDVVTPAGGAATNLGLSGLTIATEIRY